MCIGIENVITGDCDPLPNGHTMPRADHHQLFTRSLSSVWALGSAAYFACMGFPADAATPPFFISPKMWACKGSWAAITGAVGVVPDFLLWRGAILVAEPALGSWGLGSWDLWVSVLVGL